MKQLYLLGGMLLLLNVGVARGSEPPTSPPELSPSGHEADAPVLIGVSGRVTDQTGNPFPGVNVGVRGTPTGTSTDRDGRYALDVPDNNSVLVFSFVG